MEPMCSICGERLPEPNATSKCRSCEAGPRQRAVALGLLKVLGLTQAHLMAARMDKSRRGIGVSDSFSLAAALAYKFQYVNSYVDAFPVLDLKDPPREARGAFDFASCSDVLEHTMPPLKAAVDGLNRLLRMGGALVVSVPVSARIDDVEEKYPGLTSYSVARDANAFVVEGKFANGVVRRLIDPVFHGGPGSTLETRRFSPDALPRRLSDSGFEVIGEIISSEEYGIPLGTSPIILARKTAAV